MGYFKRDGGRPNFPRKNWGGASGRDRGPVTMHQAVCNQCGKTCEVPFRPTGDKPVYCNVCFGGKKETRFQDKAVNQYKEQFDMLNTKLDRIIKALTPVVSVKEGKKKKTK